MALTPQQQRFVDEYLVDLNASAAMVRAGYSEKHAGQNGYNLLRQVEVAEAVQQAFAKRSERTQITADAVLQHWWDVAHAEPQELMQLRRVGCPDCGGKKVNPECSGCGGEGVAQPWFADTRKLKGRAKLLFAGVKTTKDGIEIKVHDQQRALENVARHLGMFVDKRQMLDKDGKPVDPAMPVLNVVISRE